MRVDIHEVKKCLNGAYGNYLLRGRESALITVSMKLNPTLAEYSATLIHELLHAYTTMIRRKGFRVSDRQEHKWIYKAEDAIIKTMQRHLKKNSKGD